MNHFRVLLQTALLTVLGLANAGCLKAHTHEATKHFGMANASAVIGLEPDQFIAASDEDNILKLYSTSGDGEPKATFDSNPWLGLRGRLDEADFEGAARIGDTIYWIGSHGRNKDGKNRPNRQRLLATRLVTTNDTVQLTPVAPAYASLLPDLARAPQLSRFDLAGAARLSPEQSGGLNIEGMAATPEGGLLIAFRSPVPEGKSLLVPLLNPAELMAGKAAARIGDPILLDLGGLGVRDIVWSGREYFLIAGHPTAGGKQQLYRWGGPGKELERLEHPSFKSFNPEAITVFGGADKPRLLVLSDDGNRKQSKNTTERKFRSFWIDLK